MIMHQLYINYTQYLAFFGIVLMLEDSKCTKTWTDPWPELVVFLCFFLCFSGFCRETRLQWRTGTCSKGRQLLEALGRLRGAPGKRCRAGDLSLISFPPGERTGTPTAAWSHQQGELGLGAIGATGDGLHLSTYLSTFVYCEYYICPLWNSPFFAYFIHVASFTWWNQTEIPSDHFFA